VTTNARSILSAALLALTAIATTACGVTSTYLASSGSTTTLMQGWDHWFKLDWSVEPEPGASKLIRGYMTNEYGGRAEPVRLLAQALDASGAVVGQQIAWVPGGVGGFGRAYFEIAHLPAARHYRVFVWDYSFPQAASERP
jgi:hypothetical protein